MLLIINSEQIREAIRECKRKEHALRERDRAGGLCLSLERDYAAVEKFLDTRHGKPDREFIRKEARATLYEALNSLPAKQAVRIYRHFFNEQSYSQIARSEGVDESAVRRSIKRGLLQMRKKLCGSGISESDFANPGMIQYRNTRRNHIQNRKAVSKVKSDRQESPTPLIELYEGGEQDD